MATAICPLFWAPMSHMELLFRRLRRSTCGQDLIEYGLLAAFIAIAGVLVFPEIAARMDDIFTGWETPVYDIWEPLPPTP
jgi:Flp pilus assembly pilin Flp